MTTIQADRHIINWPRHHDIPDDQIIKIIHAQVYDQNHELIPNAYIQVNRQHFDYQNPSKKNQILLTSNINNQTATLTIDVDIVDPAKADYQPQNNTSYYPHSSSSPLKTKKKKHRWWIPLLILLALIALGFGLNSCHQQKVNQQQNQQISRLKDQNQGLKDQIQELKAATKQYQTDNDKQRLQDSLNQIKTELQNSPDTGTVRKVIDQIQSDPDHAQDYLDTLYNSSNVLANLQNQITAWLAAHGITVGD